MENYMLEHIADILKRLNDELKLDNDKWEREQNVTTTTLRPAADGTTSTGIKTTGEKDEL
jgi:hypothetical protein